MGIFTVAPRANHLAPTISRLVLRFAWAKKGLTAVADQALFAGSNFVVNILLARSLPPADYGAFAIAFSFLLLAGGLHSAAVTEPMMVFGPGKFSTGFRKYLGILICGHFALMIPLGTLLSVVGLVVAKFVNMPVGLALLGCGVAAPLITFLWLARLAGSSDYCRLERGFRSRISLVRSLDEFPAGEGRGRAGQHPRHPLLPAGQIGTPSVE